MLLADSVVLIDELLEAVILAETDAGVDVALCRMLLEAGTEVPSREAGEKTVPFDAIAVDRPEEVSIVLLEMVVETGAVPLTEEVATTVPFPEVVAVLLLIGTSVNSIVDTIGAGVEVTTIVPFPEGTATVDSLANVPGELEMEVGVSVRLPDTLDSSEDVKTETRETVAELGKVAFAVTGEAMAEVSIGTLNEVSEIT